MDHSAVEEDSPCHSLSWVRLERKAPLWLPNQEGAMAQVGGLRTSVGGPGLPACAPGEAGAGARRGWAENTQWTQGWRRGGNLAQGPPTTGSRARSPCSCSFCFFFSSFRSFTLRSLALPMPPAWRMDSSRVARPPEGSTTSLGAPWTGAGRWGTGQGEKAAQAGLGKLIVPRACWEGRHLPSNEEPRIGEAGPLETV